MEAPDPIVVLGFVAIVIWTDHYGIMSCLGKGCLFRHQGVIAGDRKLSWAPTIVPRC